MIEFVNFDLIISYRMNKIALDYSKFSSFENNNPYISIQYIYLWKKNQI